MAVVTGGIGKTNRGLFDECILDISAGVFGRTNRGDGGACCSRGTG